MARVLCLVTLLLAAILGVSGCATRVERIDVDETRDLSGRWNDTDSRLVAEALITDCLNHPWLPEFSGRSGSRPVLIVGQIRNRSSEHINTETFTKDLERAIINSGRATFVASATEREGVRDERLDQDLHASPTTRKAPGMETGADFMVIGVINSIIDQEKGERVAYYQVNLELVSLANNQKVWIGEKKIKKFISRSRFGL